MGRKLTRWAEAGDLHGELLLGQWFSFSDDNGPGFCQPDILLITPALIFILECKLSYTDWAWPQLRQLYKPIVERVFERPAITIQVCKHLYADVPGLIESIQQTMDAPGGGCLTWHFLP